MTPLGGGRRGLAGAPLVLTLLAPAVIERSLSLAYRNGAFTGKLKPEGACAAGEKVGAETGATCLEARSKNVRVG